MESQLMPEIRAIVPGLAVHVGDPDPARVLDLLKGASGILNGHTVMDATLLSKLPDLKTIVYLGTGVSNYVDLDAAQALGIQVRAIRNYGDRTIAEHAFALLLAGARQIAAMDRALRQGRWDALVGVELKDKTLGVIGTGGVGSELVRIAANFGMRVVAWNRSGVPSDLPCEAMQIDDLLRCADAVSLHVALTPETDKILDERRLPLMRPGAILVNTGRGNLIDEAALVQHLKAGRIGHAALDVFSVEPLSPTSPLVDLPNVTLSAHAAFKTSEAAQRLVRLGFEMMRRDLDAYGGAA
jgi:D-3-phosphoglycerate dehydrogenase